MVCISTFCFLVGGTDDSNGKDNTWILNCETYSLTLQLACRSWPQQGGARIHLGLSDLVQFKNGARSSVPAMFHRGWCLHCCKVDSVWVEGYVFGDTHHDSIPLIWWPSDWRRELLEALQHGRSKHTLYLASCSPCCFFCLDIIKCHAPFTMVLIIADTLGLGCASLILCQGNNFVCRYVLV